MTDLQAIAAEAARWIGREETDSDEVGLSLVRRFAAMLDRPADALNAGDALPDGWFVILFPPLAATRGLGPDGHPEKGDFLPDLPLPRRMAAERRVTFHRPLRIGEAVRRTSRIAAIEPKEGRSGLLAFVTVVHDIAGEDGLAITEAQTIVYREAAKPGDAPPPPQPADVSCDWSATVTPTVPLLFRFSAVTFNAHRIHYDADYVRGTEGYPERVVNGGLTAILMLDAAASRRNAGLAEFTVRNLRALYVDRPVTIRGSEATGADGRPATEIRVADADGALASRAVLTWRSG